MLWFSPWEELRILGKIHKLGLLRLQWNSHKDSNTCTSTAYEYYETTDIWLTLMWEPNQTMGLKTQLPYYAVVSPMHMHMHIHYLWRPFHCFSTVCTVFGRHLAVEAEIVYQTRFFIIFHSCHCDCRSPYNYAVGIAF